MKLTPELYCIGTGPPPKVSGWLSKWALPDFSLCWFSLLVSWTSSDTATYLVISLHSSVSGCSQCQTLMDVSITIWFLASGWLTVLIENWKICNRIPAWNGKELLAFPTLSLMYFSHTLLSTLGLSFSSLHSAHTQWWFTFSDVGRAWSFEGWH